MTMIFNEDTLGIWYVLLEPEKIDYMGALSRRPYGYMYTWRMRYYATPDDPWDGKDRKSWYDIRIPSAEGTTEEVIEKIREMVRLSVETGRSLGKPTPGPIHELLRGNKTMEKFTEDFLSAPFVHKKTVQ
jgi:hypothetical protein